MVWELAKDSLLVYQVENNEKRQLSGDEVVTLLAQ